MSMKPTLLAVFVIGALATTGCGSDTKGSHTTSTTLPGVTTSTATTTSPLQAKVLTTADVGAQWQAMPLNDQDLQDFPPEPCQDHAINPTIKRRLRPVAGIQFQPRDGSYGNVIEWVLTNDESRLSRDIAVIVGATDACVGNSGGAETITRLPLPPLGDQRAAYTTTQTQPSGSTSTTAPESAVVGHSGIVRVGNVAVAVGLLEVVSPPTATPRYGQEYFVKLLTAAADHLKR